MMQPPLVPAELPLSVLLVIVSVALPVLEPLFKMPPPLSAELSLSVQLLTVRVAWSL